MRPKPPDRCHRFFPGRICFCRKEPVFFLRKKLWNTVHERDSVAIMNLMQKKADQKPEQTAEKTGQKPTLTVEKRNRNRH
ncbi:MAG TPA: hypothetical protein DCF42_04440 [Lachnospiraceae bacterium]|nr:hypothetical protein [Lachnospiraceae bacterium]